MDVIDRGQQKREERISELQAKVNLSAGEKIELEMLLRRKWGV